MAAYWKLPCENFDSPLEFPKDSDIERYVKERWPSEVEYAKARLYGQVATSEIGWLPDDHVFVLPEDGYTCDEVVSFLYGIRALHGDAWDRITFPPRYQQMRKLRWPSFGFGRTKKHEEIIVDAIVSGFKGERPKMLPEIQLLKDSEVHHGCKLSEANLSLLSEVEYVGIQCRPFEESSVEWIVKLVNNATSLQVLILQGCNVPYDSLDLNYFCEQLATCRTYWSNFQILKVVPGIPENDELRDAYGMNSDDTPEEYTVSQAALNQIITAYLSAPTNHSQLVQFSFTNIITETAESVDTDSNAITESQDRNSDCCNLATLDRTYLLYKNIRFSDCRFDSSKATPEAISRWLGQRIKILEKEEETSSVLFQIDSCSVLGHKRKYREVHSEENDQ